MDVIGGMTAPSPARRALDVGGGLLALVVLSPLLAAVALLVRVTSRGPALFRQQRVGEGGSVFTLYKFRSMHWGSGGPEVTAECDPRVTPLGGLIRRTKVDELPQLLNLVRGDMTLVGPRPETVALARRYPAECRWVLAYRPGLTGPVQLGSRELAAPPDGERDPEAYYLDVLVPRRVALDAEYLAAPSLLRELALVLRTVLHLLVPIGIARTDIARTDTASTRVAPTGSVSRMT
jgi:lipopolysaccharide/colanic/teichoic acid biosynthesis glycosyltransferase